MLTTPVFRPWRPLWDAQLGDAPRRLDELAKERQKGRRTPPRLVESSDVPRILLAVQSARGRVSSSKFVQEKIEPLVKACVWPRWLLLEEALDHAATSGDLHLSALVLRSQIEELDALLTAATVLSCRGEDWDRDATADAIRNLTKRVLPRLQTKTEQQLVEQASDATLAATRPEPLQRAFDQLSEYVHPNYGSHVLSVRPHSVEAAKVFIEAFVAIYEAFLSLPWAKDSDDSREDPRPQGHPESRDPYLILADETIPALKPALPTVEENRWNDAVECFRHRAACENNWAVQNDLLTDVEAISALRANSVPSPLWPEALRTIAGQNRYAFLVAQEHRLNQDAARLVPTTVQSDDKERLSVLVSALTFAINVTEHKLDSLARQGACLINDENVLGATLAVRSMLEHHALAIELGRKLRALWEQAEKGVSNTPQVADAFAEAEKQIARVLAGTSQPSEASSSWRTLWQETVRKPYNVLGPIKALDAIQPGFLKTYGLLSHIIHGTVGTGGDLLGKGAEGWRFGHKPLAAQLTYFLANVCELDAMLDRQAASMTIAHRLDVVRRASEPTERIKQMRLLKGQKLKPGRDVFGSGTRDDPYRFRDGLLYHDAYSHYLAQEGVQVRTRMLERLSGGFGDRVEAEDGRVLYFLNDKPPLQ